MGRSRSLSESEHTVIVALYEENLRVPTIAERIKRSRKAVQNYLRAWRSGRQRKLRVPRRKLSRTGMLAVLRKATTGCTPQGSCERCSICLFQYVAFSSSYRRPRTCVGEDESRATSIRTTSICTPSLGACAHHANHSFVAQNDLERRKTLQPKRS